MKPNYVIDSLLFFNKTIEYYKCDIRKMWEDKLNENV
jgi:hypothetical protein